VIGRSGGVRISMKLEEIKTLAIRQFAKITGFDEDNVKKSMVICCVDVNHQWIEFNYADHFFHYNKQRHAIPRRF